MTLSWLVSDSFDNLVTINGHQDFRDRVMVFVNLVDVLCLSGHSCRAYRLGYSNGDRLSLTNTTLLNLVTLRLVDVHGSGAWESGVVLNE